MYCWFEVPTKIICVKIGNGLWCKTTYLEIASAKMGVLSVGLVRLIFACAISGWVAMEVFNYIPGNCTRKNAKESSSLMKNTCKTKKKRERDFRMIMCCGSKEQDQMHGGCANFKYKHTWFLSVCWWLNVCFDYSVFGVIKS